MVHDIGIHGLQSAFYRMCIYILYSGYFSGGKIFVVFVVERQNTKFLPTKQYRKVPGCGLVYCDHENFSTNWPKFTAHKNFTPQKIPAIQYYTIIYIIVCWLYSSLLLSNNSNNSNHGQQYGCRGSILHCSSQH